MSRRLRSRCNYNASKVPTAPKRRANKRMAPKTANCVEPKTSNKTTDEQAIVPARRVQLTFGTMPQGAREQGKRMVVLGVGKRQGIAFANTKGVKLSPLAYMALTQQAPPIWKVLSWLLPINKTRQEADAPMNREATSEQSVELVEQALVEQTSAPTYADNQQTATEVPTTPNMDAESRRELDNKIFVTARTSCVLNESIVLDNDSKPMLAQYIVNDERGSKTPPKSSKRKRTCHKSKGKGKERELDISVSTKSKSTANHEGLTWDKEVRQANGNNGGPGNVEELPDISDWINPNWSQLDYIPTSEGDCTKAKSRNKATPELEELQKTRGAGPSRQPRVTIKEVDSRSEDTTTSCTRSHKSKGKAKTKAKGKKRKRPSLGAALDDLEGTQEHHIQQTDSQSTPNAYRGRGYLEGIIESTLARKSSKTTQTDMGKARKLRCKEQQQARLTKRRPPSLSDSSKLSETDSNETESTHTSRYGGGGAPDPSDSGSKTANLSNSSWTKSLAQLRNDNRQRNRQLEELVAKLKKQNKKLEQKVVTQAQSGYKAQSPKTYKGKADIDKLDMFIFSYNLYVSDTRLSDSKAVLTVSQFLDNKAASWYMLNVALDPGSYSMELIYVGLYDYCFPPDFKDNMRKLYNKKKQGDLGVQDYFAKLACLQRRLQEVTDHQHVLRVWDSAAQYIKVGWALKGMRLEATTCKTLQETALDIDGQAKGCNRQENQQRKLTNKKKAKLRAAGLCFECKQLGHLSKDCPKFHKAKPLHVNANVVKVHPKSKVRVLLVMLKELDNLTRLKEKIKINAVGVGRKNKEPGPKHVEQNAIKVKDHTRKVLNMLIVEANLEGKSVCVLLDLGCQTDMVSTTIVDQLRLPKVKLTKPLQVQLAMAGLQGTLHYGVKARIEYQGIDEY
ncbi:Zinc finger, CCHC-type [Rhizoctonia solani]|uniref:Zinc finger, CCHC-type n=1 Tax=Rhizoctonia solani TaxID=456999 RepID=A0A8H8NXL5_9AGAM|nr:Zinc finger, CCHC-type [Rhizoctonia solani]QRW20520.1 Zinc finger, CCHC-type [Rhizoctonia solani]